MTNDVNRLNLHLCAIAGTPQPGILTFNILMNRVYSITSNI